MVALTMDRLTWAELIRPRKELDAYQLPQTKLIQPTGLEVLSALVLELLRAALAPINIPFKPFRLR
jgi:hypothetical protein